MALLTNPGGLTVVVSPLISLIQDQKNQLKEGFMVEAAAFDSSPSLHTPCTCTPHPGYDIAVLPDATVPMKYGTAESEGVS